MTQEGILKSDMDSSVIEDEENSDEEFSKFLFATKENLSRLTLNSSVFEDEDNSDEEFSKFLAATKENLSRLTLNSKLNSFSAKAQMNVLEKTEINKCLSLC
ncbi:uncharacterized protein LOC118180484 isoform X1 [Stegodyphus dumicola]|uniref:uncharacterized protein LOC118180484 isoform X1 n=1 Tax=Stegodyphus dumicola TaxID=202533 RepID=UPI0015A81E04|nr:uncharacterized protein LOC118180484 isoform X1 [Stegodyphus dumicola]